jgi:hypothetical protein
MHGDSFQVLADSALSLTYSDISTYVHAVLPERDQHLPWLVCPGSFFSIALVRAGSAKSRCRSVAGLVVCLRRHRPAKLSFAMALTRQPLCLGLVALGGLFVLLVALITLPP